MPARRRRRCIWCCTRRAGAENGTGAAEAARARQWEPGGSCRPQRRRGKPARHCRVAGWLAWPGGGWRLDRQPPAGQPAGQGDGLGNALDLFGKGGSSDLRCFAVLMDAKHGTGSVQPLALASSLLTMTGSGTVNLGAETLAMELRPRARLGGTDVVIPLEVTGPMGNPKVGVNRAGAAEPMPALSPGLSSAMRHRSGPLAVLSAATSCWTGHPTSVPRPWRWHADRRHRFRPRRPRRPRPMDRRNCRIPRRS